jgi:hypothetical protein
MVKFYEVCPPGRLCTVNANDNARNGASELRTDERIFFLVTVASGALESCTDS